MSIKRINVPHLTKIRVLNYFTLFELKPFEVSEGENQFFFVTKRLFTNLFSVISCKTSLFLQVEYSLQIPWTESYKK